MSIGNCFFAVFFFLFSISLLPPTLQSSPIWLLHSLLRAISASPSPACTRLGQLTLPAISLGSTQSLGKALKEAVKEKKVLLKKGIKINFFVHLWQRDGQTNWHTAVLLHAEGTMLWHRGEKKKCLGQLWARSATEMGSVCLLYRDLWLPQSSPADSSLSIWIPERWKEAGDVWTPWLRLSKWRQEASGKGRDSSPRPLSLNALCEPYILHFAPGTTRTNSTYFQTPDVTSVPVPNLMCEGGDFHLFQDAITTVALHISVTCATGVCVCARKAAMECPAIREPASAGDTSKSGWLGFFFFTWTTFDRYVVQEKKKKRPTPWWQK